MKAIYINLDPYLQAVADWLNAGKPGDAPTFTPLPLAVTIPLGESAALYLVADAASTGTDIEPQTVTVGSQTIVLRPIGYDDTGLPDGTIAFNQTPALSALAPGVKYAVIPVIGDSVAVTIGWTDDVIDFQPIPFTVLVRREQASGPVDLVDFTPPASAIAAGTDLKGATFDGNVIVAAETTGALSAPAGD